MAQCHTKVMQDHEFDRHKLRAQIDKKGLLQKWVAAQSEISSNYLTQILNGDKTPSPRVWKLLAQTLEIEWIALAKSPNKAKAS